MNTDIKEMEVDEFIDSDGNTIPIEEVFRPYSEMEFKNCINQNDDNQFDFLFNNAEIRFFYFDENPWFIAKDLIYYLAYEGSKNVTVICNNITKADNLQVFTRDQIIKGLRENPIYKEILENSIVSSGHNSDLKNIKNRDSSLLAINNAGMLCISEEGVYDLCRHSHKPNADKLYEWIHNRVLPNIRRTGTYMTPKAMTELSNDPLLVHDKVDSNLGYISWHDYLSAAQDITKVSGDPKVVVDKMFSLQRAIICTMPESMQREQMATIRQAQLDRATVDSALTARDKAKKKYDKEHETVKTLESQAVEMARELGSTKSALRKREIEYKKLKTRTGNIISELKGIIQENGLSSDSTSKKVMCHIIPDDIRAKLSYEEFVALRDLSK